MIIYEVNLEVLPEVAKDFSDWLENHIQKMLGLGIFTQARWYSRNPEEEGKQTQSKLWTVHYYLNDRRGLEEYLQRHAAAMRQEGLERFPSQFQVHRRVLMECGPFKT